MVAVLGCYVDSHIWLESELDDLETLRICNNIVKVIAKRQQILIHVSLFKLVFQIFF